MCLFEQTKFQLKTYWIVQQTNYFRNCGFSVPCTTGEQNRKFVAQRIWDLQAEKEMANVGKVGKLKWMSCYKHPFQIVQYWNSEMPKHLWEVFTQARSEQLDKMFTEDLTKSLIMNKVVFVDFWEIEDVTHLWFEFNCVRSQNPGLYIRWKTYWYPYIKITCFLCDQKSKYLYNMALYLNKTVQLVVVMINKYDLH